MDIRSVVSGHFSAAYPGRCRIYNLNGSSAALLLALQSAPFVAIEQDETAATALHRDILFFRRLLGQGGNVLFLPEPDGPEAAGARASFVHAFTDGDSVVTSASGHSSLPAGSLATLALEIKKGAIMSRTVLEEGLVSMGYRSAPMVAERGEYSRREWIIDVFPSTADDPLRIEFFGDEIESLRPFDVSSQRSKGEADAVVLFASGEAGESARLTDLAADNRVFCLAAVVDPTALPETVTFLSRYAFIPDDSGEDDEALERFDAAMRPLRGTGILPEERKGIVELPDRIRRISRQNLVIIVASSGGQAERLRELFREQDLFVPVLAAGDISAAGERVVMTIGSLSAGISMPGLVILTEREIFGDRTAVRQLKRSRVSALLISLDDIATGDFVVHRDHGVGRFTGVVRQERDGVEIELLTIEYEDGRLYIPVQNIQVITKYRAEEGAAPSIDRIGGKTWQKKKERAKKKIHEMAERLLALYAGRKSARGFTFSPDTEMHREFEGFFAYEETPDQLGAIADIKRDMESDKPMERLICGDVGYGKTEVAMRAAFKAVFDNRQVAVLVPTTILAEQHYRTFRERFSGFPVAVDFISRFKGRKETDATLKAVAAGTVDIIIGTHGLLSKKAVFNRLGLLIVDEEHRFGVGQKEKIKELSRAVDVLTMTATPIPRTLHMALSGIRDISVIETPPEERLAVKSVVTTFNDAVVRDAVRHELDRAGQVFFVHNRVHDILKVARRIQELVPEARLAVAHGQMPERELEEVMHRFFGGEVDLLVSTSIVGSGIDVPRANTIIVDMADRMGLADLYQLRGRVGRSKLKGYAFFLAPPESLLTDEAKKRLQAVQEMSYLGAGFRLALKDLEIRGAGDVFGPDQSGHIHEIGFDLYMEMLEKAVAELKGVAMPDETDPVIELKMAALIPEVYVGDVTLRLSLYRRVASLVSESEVEDFARELADRFGPLPPALENLLAVMRLKIVCRRLSVTKVKEAGGSVRVTFSAATSVRPDEMLGLGSGAGKGRLRFQPDGFEIKLKDPAQEKACTLALEMLHRLAPPESLSS